MEARYALDPRTSRRRRPINTAPARNVLSRTTELGSGTLATLNTTVLPPIALKSEPVLKVNVNEFAVEDSVIVALPRPPEANDTPVIAEVKPVKLIVKLPGPAPAVLPAKPNVTCVPDTLAEPLSPLPVPHAFGGPTQKPGPDTPTVNGPVVSPVTTVLPVVLPEALNVPLRAALALVAESRHSAPTITAVHVIAPRLVLLSARFRNRMFVPSLLGMMLFGPIRLHARSQKSWMELRVAILHCGESAELSGSTLGDRGPQLSHSLRCFTLLRSSSLLPAIAPPSPTSVCVSIRKHTCLLSRIQEPIQMRSRLRAGALVCLTVMVLSSCARPEAKKARFIAQGKKFLEAKDYNRAIIAFKNAAAAVPDDAEAQYQLGSAYIAAGDTHAAAGSFQRATELNPAHAGAQIMLAQQLARSGDAQLIEDARDRVKNVLSSSPDNIGAVQTLALTEFQLGRPEEAERQLRQALSRFPRNLTSAVSLADLLLSRKDLSGAEAALKEAVAQAPDSADALVALAAFYAMTGKLQAAEDQAVRALKIDSKSGSALVVLAGIQLTSGRRDEWRKPISGLPLFQITNRSMLCICCRTARRLRESPNWKGSQRPTQLT